MSGSNANKGDPAEGKGTDSDTSVEVAFTSKNIESSTGKEENIESSKLNENDTSGSVERDTEGNTSRTSHSNSNSSGGSERRRDDIPLVFNYGAHRSEKAEVGDEDEEDEEDGDDDDDDDPPPYTLSMPANHVVGWSFDFRNSSNIPYSEHMRSFCRPEVVPLATFQVPLMSGTTGLPFAVDSTATATATGPPNRSMSLTNPCIGRGTAAAETGIDTRTATRHSSISFPLTPYLRLAPNRSTFTVPRRLLLLPDNARISKGFSTSSRGYGAILVAATVIISLMALSLLVRFVVKRTF